MGSLFILTVPVREHEIHLRTLESKLRQITRVNVEPPPQPPAPETSSQISLKKSKHHKLNDDHMSIMHSVLPASFSASESRIPEPELPPPAPTPIILSSIPPHKRGTPADVYTAVSDGVQVRVFVTDDSMEVVGSLLPSASSSANINEGRKKSGGMSVGTAVIMNAIDHMFLEKHLEDCLRKFKIMDGTWGQSVDMNYSQITFSLCDEKVEGVINHLRTVGIGKKYESSICVCATTVFDEPDVEEGSLLKGDAVGSKEDLKKSKWNEFVQSIKSRLTVAQVVQSVKANAILTFDYIVLILVAGMIAGLGLIDDSSVNVVASMLVSPLMGPIMAGTFGTVIRDWELIRIGVKNELIGLSLCILEGYIMGLLIQVHIYDGPWKNAAPWPTDQMTARGKPWTLLVGVLVAIPSGAGVALSILAGNSGSLVGVAISASLLPPCVNCGIFWGMATVIAITERVRKFRMETSCHKFLASVVSKKFPPYRTGNAPIVFCKNVLQEFFFMGLNSLTLAVINIVVIFLVGIFILWVKEVAPHTTRNSLNRFWKEDLKVARKFNQQGNYGNKNLMQTIEDTDGRQKDALLRKIEFDPTFNAVGRRANTYSILTDVRRRGDIGSQEDLRELKERGSQEQLPPPPTKSKGLLSSWFGSGGVGDRTGSSQSITTGSSVTQANSTASALTKIVGPAAIVKGETGRTPKKQFAKNFGKGK